MSVSDAYVYALHERIEQLEAQLAKVTAERDEWKEASARHHPNPADHRYWEGRYRDEKAGAESAEAAIPRAYQMGLDAAAGKAMEYRWAQEACAEEIALSIRALTPTADLAERAKGTDHE